MPSARGYALLCKNASKVTQRQTGIPHRKRIQTDAAPYRRTVRRTDGQTDKQTERQTDRQTGRPTDRQTKPDQTRPDRQTDRQIGMMGLDTHTHRASF